jgi:uncharacterized protein YcbK (DUF882 family)
MTLKPKNYLDDTNEGSFFEREKGRRQQEIDKNVNPVYGVELNAVITRKEGPFVSPLPPPGLDVDSDEWNIDVKWFKFICKPQKATQHIIEEESSYNSNISNSYKKLLVDTSLDSNFYFYEDNEKIKVNDRVLVSWDSSGDEVKFIKLVYSSKKATNSSSTEEKSKLRELFNLGLSVFARGQTYTGPDIESNFPDRFNLKILTRTSQSYNNTPNDREVSNLQNLVTKLLDPIQQRLKNQELGNIMITSGFRGEQVNNAVGGSKNSQHRFGEAVDFAVPPGFNSETFSRWIYKGGFEFDQMIWYDAEIGGHIHISYREGRNRKDWRHAYKVKETGKTTYDLYSDSGTTAENIDQDQVDI